MKSLTIVTTWGTKYWPNPVQPCIESTINNWPDHAKILLYPDDMSQQINSDRCYHFDLCKEQPKLQDFIDRHKDNPKFVDKKNWLPEIYQIGVRNPLVLTVSPFDI